MTRMFLAPNGKRMRTWNVFSGCNFDCYYCWARRLITGRLANTEKYRYCRFKPTLHKKELKAKFSPNDFVFVAALGDIRFTTASELEEIILAIQKYPQTQFLLQTKDPILFLDGRIWDSNIYLGTTIETNREITISKAPQPIERYHSIATNNHHQRFISIEPIMDFDFEILLSWIKDIKPEIVEIGADNYRSCLPEPSWDKVEALLKGLREICPTVIEKQGLERLKVNSGENRTPINTSK